VPVTRGRWRPSEKSECFLVETCLLQDRTEALARPLEDPAHFLEQGFDVKWLGEVRELVLFEEGPGCQV
jgi:hypothetical protein